MAEQKPVQFLQSWQWAEFQKKLGRQIFYLKGKWGQSLVIKHQLPFSKNYLYCPRGPLLNSWDKKILELFIKEITELAKKEKSIFLRFEPPVVSKFEIQNFKFKKVADLQPSKTTILNLSKSEEELLSTMHYKTRYNIRLAKRQGVQIREGKGNEIEKFLKLLHQTARRNKFRPYSDNYYHQLLSFNQNFVKLFLAEYKDKVLAANIIIFFADTTTYVHGASSDEAKNLMASHLLQWDVICQAKKLGYQFYDFWGIDENKWPGITRFKRGFGGEEIKYAGTFDLVFNKFWYQLYTITKKFF
ncbi:MAG: lipid II:glycine glycyltransferase FemX [Patescibacteria group bacterium]